MYLKKRVLPFFFSLVLAVGLFPSYGFAAAQADDPEVSVAAVTASGTLGGCSWEYDGDTNTLTIHAGNGSNMSSDEKTAYDAAKTTATTIVFQKSDGNEYVRGFVDTASLVSGASNAETLDLTGLDTVTPTSMVGMFTGCDKLITVTVGEDFTFKNTEGVVACTLPDGMWKVASTFSIVSAHDIAEARFAGSVETYTRQADVPGPSYQSYTVRYLKEGTTDPVAPAKVVNDQTVGSVVTESAIDIDGYDAVAPTSQTITIDTSNNVITFYYRTTNDLSCTVNYLEQGTGKSLAPAKVSGSQAVGTEVTESAAEIDGYNLVGAASQTITIGTSGNVITFYYTARTDLSYMVTYLEKGTDEYVANPKTVTNQTFGTQVTEKAIAIDGYDAVAPTSQTITIGTSGNVIAFYYTEADENGGNGDNGDDNPPVNPGKPSTGDDDPDPGDNDGDGNVEAPTHMVMHRLYNPNSGEHFFTTSAAEKANLVNLGWKDEGEGWVAATSGTSVYRLYNPNAGEHHYTTSSDERAVLIAAGWNDEGVGFYSDDDKGTPLYRLYNPNEFANNHHYTRNTAERDALKALGWRDEGIGWYGIS